MLKKRFCAAVSAIAIYASSLFTPALAEWHDPQPYAAIDKTMLISLFSMDKERGVYSYAPTALCTRAEAIQLLWRYAGEPTSQIYNSFADVGQDAYYSAAVAWARASGITVGVGENLFAPDQYITSKQTVTMFHRMKVGDPVQDSYATSAELWALEGGLISFPLNETPMNCSTFLDLFIRLVSDSHSTG